MGAIERYRNDGTGMDVQRQSERGREKIKKKSTCTYPQITSTASIAYRTPLSYSVRRRNLVAKRYVEHFTPTHMQATATLKIPGVDIDPGYGPCECGFKPVRS